MFTTASLLAGLQNRLRPVFHFSTARVRNSSGSTVNMGEVDKFKAMASDWWNPYGVCKPLHSMNALRIPLIREGILQSGLSNAEHRETSTPLAGLKILDVGCGGGIVSEPLARIGASVVGIDACPENIEAARHHADLDPKLRSGLSYRCTTVEEHLETSPSSYDAVVASEVIEHVDNPQVFLRKCSQLLKPEGSIFLTTLNRTNRSWLFGIVGAEYILGLLPKGTHQWEKFVRPEELEKMLCEAECDTRSVQGMCYLPWANVWAWGHDASVNYALHAVKRMPE